MADTSPYMIGGALPFNAPSVNPFQYAGSPQMALASLGPAYNSAYGNALALNSANYNNILAGYQNTVGNQVSALGDLGGDYDQLLNSVLGTVKDTGASTAQAIKDAYAQQSGQASQDLINRGLGNTTVQQGVQRGLTLDQQKAQTNLQNQMAQLSAGYQSQIGGAKLAAQQQAALANAALQQAQLGFMERVNAPYPDAGLYGSLAGQYGGAMQAFADRQALAGSKPRGGIMGGAPPSIGYVASGGGMPRPRSFGGGGGAGYGVGGGDGYNPALNYAAPAPAWNPGYVPAGYGGGGGNFSPGGFGVGGGGGGGVFGALAGAATAAGSLGGLASSYADAGGGGGYPTMDLTDMGDMGGDLFDAGL